MLCEMRGGITTDSCRVIDRKSKPDSGAVIETLLQSDYGLPPGHSTVAAEKMLRVGRGEPASKQYLGCHRVVRYVESQDVFINQVQTDPVCTRFEKYRAGMLVVPRSSNVSDWR